MALAAEIAPAIVNPLWQLSEVNALRMGAAEARGYLRARCAGLVRVEVNMALQRAVHLDQRAREQLLRATTDRTLELVMPRYRTARTLERDIPLRRAA